MESFDIFNTDDGWGRATDMHGLMEWMQNAVENEGIDLRQVIDVIIDLVRPGNSDNSHDVRPMWTAAMYVQGFGEVTSRVAGMYLNTMPWGLGFAISVEQGFQFEALSAEAKLAVIRAMCAVINMGGLSATVGEDGTIHIEHGDGGSTDISANDIVNQFRQEIDAELGPDAPTDDNGNPLRRWMP